MKLTKERKVFVGVLVVAVAALLMDQVFFAPASVSAGTVPPADASAGAAPTVLAEDAGAAPKTGSLAPIARRVRETGVEGHTLSDAFSIPESWGGIAASAGTDGVEEPGIDPARALSLSAVLPGASGLAIINGHSVRVGEVVPGTGYRLISVRTGSAVLRDGAREHTLKMREAPYMKPITPRGGVAPAGDSGSGPDT